MGYRPGDARLSGGETDGHQGDDGLTLQNRVQPTGQIIADPARGSFMGNRGILHDTDRRLGVARWRHKVWVTCQVHFKNRKRVLMAPGRYTELFFHDEAVALAAGHRPCAECRNADYKRFRAGWKAALGPVTGAPDIDRVLHGARVRRDRTQVRHAALASALPDGAFVMLHDRPHLILQDAALPFSAGGYGAPVRRPQGEVSVLTPAPLLAVLHAGYRAQIRAPY